MVWEKSQSASVVDKSTEVSPLLMVLQKNQKMAQKFFGPFCPRTLQDRKSGVLPHLKENHHQNGEEDEAEWSELRLSSSKLLAYGLAFHPLHVSPVRFISEDAALNKVVKKKKKVNKKEKEKRRGEEKEEEEKGGSEENLPEETKKRKKGPLQCPHCVGWVFLIRNVF